MSATNVWSGSILKDAEEKVLIKGYVDVKPDEASKCSEWEGVIEGRERRFSHHKDEKFGHAYLDLSSDVI